MAVDKAALLDNTRVLPHEPVEVPGVGDVEVRGLSRAEVVQMQGCGSADAMEVAAIAAGMVDPKLTPEEVAEWRSAKGSDEIRPVSDAILRLSGLVEGAQTAKERSFRPGRG